MPGDENSMCKGPVARGSKAGIQVRKKASQVGQRGFWGAVSTMGLGKKAGARKHSALPVSHGEGLCPATFSL